ncbi:hypothetical protein QUF74_18985 [Candidatus Halobeggiatoa sp. HSG11]|nr:hypothetical protein [Candidatus Halobeggiatoa sp. HSG11]
MLLNTVVNNVGMLSRKTHLCWLKSVKVLTDYYWDRVCVTENLKLTSDWLFELSCSDNIWNYHLYWGDRLPELQLALKNKIFEFQMGGCYVK